MAEKARKILMEVCVDSVDSALAFVSACFQSIVNLTHRVTVTALFVEAQIGSSYAETWGLEVDSNAVLT
jgi:hypothetical protein